MKIVEVITLKEKLIIKLKDEPQKFWEEFNELAGNFDILWQYLQAIYETHSVIPLECSAKYQNAIEAVYALIQCKDISINERRNLIIKALKGERNPYNLLNIKSYNQYLFVMNFGEIYKELCGFVNRLSVDILNNMNSKHFQIFLSILENKGFNYTDSVKLAFQVYHVLGFYKGRDFLLGKYGDIPKSKLKNIFGSIDLSEVVYDLDKKEPILNNTIINLLLGESYHVQNTPIKKYLDNSANEDINYFVENLNLVLSNWDLIITEYTKRANLEALKLRLNIGQIRTILSNIIDMKRDIKRKESFRGRKKARYEKIPNFEIRDLPLLESDLFDYISTFNKYVTSPRTAPERAVTISRMMEEKDSKKFPEVSINEGKNYLFTFHPQDRDIISAGFRTSNCFVPNGAGDGYGVGVSLLEYCATTPYGGGIEIRDKVGKTVAFSPILRNGNVLFVHSIEGIKLTSEEKKVVMLLLKAWADEVIKISNEKEKDGGIALVVTAEDYYIDTNIFPDVLDESKRFHIYDPENKYNDMYGNFSNPSRIISLRKGSSIDEIRYDYPIDYDYVYSISELGSNHKIVDFSENELAMFQDLNEMQNQIVVLAETRKMLLKNHQEVLAMEMLREIRRIKENFNEKYQELFKISTNHRVDQFKEFNDAYQTIKTIYEEIDSQLDFDIYTAKRIYYSDNWFVAVDLNGELHYECIAGAEYQFLTVLNDVKRQLDEGVRR